MSDNVVVNKEGPSEADAYKEPAGSMDGALCSWVMGKVDRWRQHRDANYLDDWNKYYNLWRGKWTDNLKQKNAERSRLIAPALQSAVDQTVAEEIEAIFGRSKWIDVADDYSHQDKPAAEALRDQLLEDFKRSDVPGAIRETLLNAAIFGTGISKCIVDELDDYNITRDEFGNVDATSTQKFVVYWQAIPPDNFVIDSSALTIDQALGVAHESIRPRHEIYAKQRAKVYRDTPVGGLSGMRQTLGYRPERGEVKDINSEDGVYVTEYHGWVPRSLLSDSSGSDSVSTSPGVGESIDYTLDVKDNEEMVEVIVTIANGGILLRVNENPVLMKDRAFAAFSHDRVPNRFWGRGVCEKGFNSQLALDAELRARIDALGLLTYPVMGADATRLPRNLNLTITPGKTFLTNGRPSEIIEPITFGNLEQSTFQQSGDMERFVQVATGAMDTSTPVNVNPGNSTASGMSMQTGSAIKRAKMTMQNIDGWLDDLVHKSLLRYMQFDPERYHMDLSYTVSSTMSIMAKEFEQAQMTNLLAVIPQESPAYLLVLKAIVENYTGPSRTQIVAGIDKMMQPDPNKQKMDQATQMLQFKAMQNEVLKGAAEIAKLKVEMRHIAAQTQGEQVDTKLAPIETQIKAKAIQVQAVMAHADHHDNRANTLIAAHKAASDRIKAKQPPKAPTKA